MALNFLRAGCKHVCLVGFQRPPSELQAEAFERIGVLVRACSRQAGAVPSCAGRRGLHTAARLSEVCSFLSRSGVGPGTYSSEVAPTSFLTLRGGRPSCGPMAPYPPSKLLCMAQLSGTLQLTWTLSFSCPTSSLVLRLQCNFREGGKEELLELCRIWDARGLLGLTTGPLPESSSLEFSGR